MNRKCLPLNISPISPPLTPSLSGAPQDEGREESLGSRFGFLLHHSGGVLGYLTAAGAQVEVQAPHWAFAAVSARGATDSSGEFG